MPIGIRLEGCIPCFGRLPNFNIFFRKKIPVNYVVFLIIFRVLSCGVKVIMTDVSSSYIKLIEETQISIFSKRPKMTY